MAAIWTTPLTTWANKALSITRLNAYLGINGNLQWLKERAGKVDVAFNSANFTAPQEPTCNWNVNEQHQETFCYTPGDICTMVISLSGTSIETAVATELAIALPITSLSWAGCAFRYYDTANHIGFATVRPNGEDIRLFPDPAHGHFNVCNGDFLVRLTISFPVDD